MMLGRVVFWLRTDRELSQKAVALERNSNSFNQSGDKGGNRQKMA